MFAQRSCDHRGTSVFPGLVVTLVDVSSLNTFNTISSFSSSSSVSTSVSYCNNNDSSFQSKGEIILSNKDEIIINEDDQGSSCTGLIWLVNQEDVVDVIAELDYRERGGYERQIVKVKILEDTPFHKTGDFADVVVYRGSITNPNFKVNSHSNAADIIAAAHGKSGPNAEYIFNLVNFMTSHKLEDDYIKRLAHDVYRRLGPWRSKLFDYRNDYDGYINGTTTLMGWGSNEFRQLRQDDGEIFCEAVDINIIDNDESIEHADILFSGGSASAILKSSKKELILWGVNWDHNANSSNDVKTFSNVIGAAFGHNHGLLLRSSGKITSFGDNTYNQCTGPDFVIYSSIDNEENDDDSNEDNIKSDVNIVKVAAGLKHSAAITSDGKLYCWGDKKITFNPNEYWQAPDNATLIDVSCSAYHTTVIDNYGRMWSFGDNRHGSLGRNIVPENIETSSRPSMIDMTPGLISPIPDKCVRWQRVCCGWGHVVARGILESGDLIFGCWGRSDMNQYIADADADADAISCSQFNPKILQALPSERKIREVWTGSEYTIVSDEKGYLWSTGWNEHGNLGNGTFESSNNWTPILLKGNQIKLSLLWEGSLACGGGHVLCSALKI